jgi:chemotaxis protein histidine kinase CheA
MVAKLNPLAELRYAPDTGARPRVLAFHFIRIREPSTSRGARVEKIMVVFDDRTIEHELGEALERQLEAYTTKIERIYRILTLPRAEFEQFIHDAREALSEISALFGQQTTAQPDAEALLRIQRASHTLKGHARAFGMEALTDLIHELEERLEAPHGSPCAHRRHEILEILASIRAEIDDGQAILARFADMGGAVARQRRKPTDEIEFALRKLVTDTASRLGKTVDLYYHRDVPAVPAMVLRVMKTVLIHVVGNAVVHGIEYSSERARRSKPGEGRIEVEISPAASGVSILCRDDGRGLDINAIRQVAVERGVVEPSTAQTMTSEEVHRLIFVPGVSTASTTTTAAGRGIGMDAVSDAVHSLGGRIKVQSEPGKFTEFHVFIPNVRTPAVEETHEDLGR